MTFIKISKRVRPGTLVTKHGDKYVRCGPHRQPSGVYQDANTLRILSSEGLQTFFTPAGIVMQGRTSAKRSDE